MEKNPQQNSNKPEDLSMKIKVAFMAKPQENKRKKKRSEDEKQQPLLVAVQGKLSYRCTKMAYEIIKD